MPVVGTPRPTIKQLPAVGARGIAEPPHILGESAKLTGTPLTQILFRVERRTGACGHRVREDRFDNALGTQYQPPGRRAPAGHRYSLWTDGAGPAKHPKRAPHAQP